MIERDLPVGDGRTLHVYDTAPQQSGRFCVVWHHGTPNLGMPPEPLFAAAERLGLRWVSFDRPGYGSSTARVNLSEAEFLGNHCVVAASSFGSLIHTAVGSAGGSGSLRTKRSGCSA